MKTLITGPRSSGKTMLREALAVRINDAAVVRDGPVCQEFDFYEVRMGSNRLERFLAALRHGQHLVVEVDDADKDRLGQLLFHSGLTKSVLFGNVTEFFDQVVTVERR